MRRATAWTVTALLAFGLACGGAGGGSSGGNPGTLTLQEIQEVEAQYNNMLSVIENLRPAWLQTRGNVSLNLEGAGDVVVFVDGNRRGSVESLRQISPTNVGEAEYLNAREATTRYGTGYSGGIINIETRQG